MITRMMPTGEAFTAFPFAGGILSFGAVADTRALTGR